MEAALLFCDAWRLRAIWVPGADGRAAETGGRCRFSVLFGAGVGAVLGLVDEVSVVEDIDDSALTGDWAFGVLSIGARGSSGGKRRSWGNRRGSPITSSSEELD